MRPKNPNNVSSWRFNLVDPEGIELSIPNIGTYNTRELLFNAVMSYVRVYDEVTKGGYTKKAREEAEKWGVSFEVYMRKVIDHQMCLTNRAIDCWSDGLGDDLHKALGKVDGYVKRTPAIVRKTVQAAIQKLTPSKSATFGGCSSCGGSRVFRPYENNLGRAGRMNNLFKKK